MRLPVLISLAFLLALSIASALSVQPQSVTLNISVGDSVSIPINITTEVPTAVAILSDNGDCVVENPFFNISTGLNAANITLYVPANATTGNAKCRFSFHLLEYPSDEPGPSHSGGGGGGSGGGSGSGSGGGSGFGASFTKGQNATTGEKLCTYTPRYSNVSRQIRCDLVPSVTEAEEENGAGTSYIGGGGGGGGGSGGGVTVPEQNEPQQERPAFDTRTFLVLVFILIVFVALVYWRVRAGKL